MVNYISSLPSQKWEQARPRRLCILGCTGSIGVNGLRVAECHPDLFEVTALAAGRNVQLLAEQAGRWRPAWLGVLNEDSAERLLPLLPAGYHPNIVVGPEGYARLASLPEVSTVLAAQVGAAGLPGAIAAALAGKVICLANKESLVLAGTLLRSICRYSGAVVLPVDSEHNAVFQAMRRREEDVERIIITASGGPFRGCRRDFLRSVTAEQALKHPNWSMGAKVTIDSASLMNKGLEVMEAYHLYGVPVEKIGVLVHPQSIVHALVEFHDGSLLAHLGTPDMRMPIAHCLAWPRCEDCGVAPLDLAKAGTLTFEEPDMEAFPCLGLALKALYGTLASQVALNAANELAVEAFLAGRIGFMDIPELIAAAMAEADEADGAAASTAGQPPAFLQSFSGASEAYATLARIEAFDASARQRTKQRIAGM